MPDALHVPRQAVFDKNGKNHVFVKIGERFEQREVKVEQRTESRVAITGVAEGDRDRARRSRPLRAGQAAASGRAARARGRRRRDERRAARLRRRPTPTSCPSSGMGLENLRAHKLRSLLTMLGMIFGVAAVVAMLSIGAGAQQEVMAFIEQLGVRNLIVEAREAPDYAGAAEDPQALAGPELPGLPRHPGQPRGHHRGDARASASRRRSCCRKPQARSADGLRRQPRRT